MSVEEGETLRLCPAKLREEDNRIVSQYMGIPALDPPILVPGEAPPERKSPSELSCPAECPGKIVKKRRLLGFIPLPSVEVCPMKSDTPTRNAPGL